jgi:MSHA biogenesis protein MshJ
VSAPAKRLLARFDRLSVRERAMISMAVLATLVALWDVVLMQPLRDSKLALTQELTGFRDAASLVDDPDSADPRRAALTRAADLQTQSNALDSQLTSAASGFIPSARMVEVIHDVLSRQHELKLISLRNLPVASLVPPAAAPIDETLPGPVVATSEAPYVHPLELVIEGEYRDVLEYLEALEALPWRFRWKTLDLTTRGYPVNRVRIELSTLSMDRTWLGV